MFEVKMVGSSNVYLLGVYVVVMNFSIGVIYVLVGVSWNLFIGKVIENVLGIIN